MSSKTYTLKELKREEANFFDLRHAGSEAITLTAPLQGGEKKKPSPLGLSPIYLLPGYRKIVLFDCR